MQVDEKVVALFTFVFRVVTTFEGESSAVFYLEINASNCFALDYYTLSAHVAEFVEVP